MKVVNKKTRKEYDISEADWNKLKANGLSVRFSIIKEAAKFQPRELKIEKDRAITDKK